MIKIIEGIIDRRILINYRIDPDYLVKILPNPFKPRLINGYGLGGICLIRFKEMRPVGFPKIFGTSSENGTHRFCVEWTENQKLQNGIYIKQRFTNSKLHEFGSNKVFPGTLLYSKFKAKEEKGYYQVSFSSNTGEYTNIQVHEIDQFPKDSIFKTIESASEDFYKDKVGYSASKTDKNFKGVKLNTIKWKVTPLNVDLVESSLFSNKVLFPENSIKIDHALLMKDIKHNWEDIGTLCCS